ncbi:MAG TPA: HdeD family acid-resistance protein [Ktedonobacteraceae bacterium]|nr:HdeD family acid-resistance protein [Ktedonobacteraceae bacterium]
MSVFAPVQTPRQYRWSMVIRGVVGIIFGILALVWPGFTYLILVYLFGAYALIDGIIAIVVSFQERQVYKRWWAVLIEGIIGVIAGLVTFFWPAITAFVLIYVIAVWAVIMGIFEIVEAFALPHAFGWEWALALGGVLSVILGILLFLRPVAGILALVWFIAIYAIIWGILLIIRAFQYRAPGALPI